MDDIQATKEDIEKIKIYTAKKSCKHCYERGYIGTTKDGLRVRCRCVKVSYAKPKKD